MTNDDNYNKSNSITSIPYLKFSQLTKKQYHEFRDLKEITYLHLNSLLHNILNDLGLQHSKLEFKNRRPCQRKNGRITSEIHGKYNPAINRIWVYQFTAAKGKLISAKSAISTLLHEINHYVDMVTLNLNSIHCKGFYDRLGQMQKAMD